jgi:hypothetical protein
MAIVEINKFYERCGSGYNTKKTKSCPKCHQSQQKECKFHSKDFIDTLVEIRSGKDFQTAVKMLDKLLLSHDQKLLEKIEELNRANKEDNYYILRKDEVKNIIKEN